METKHTQGEWYVSDIPQEDGRYIYTKENPFSAIARVYKGENPHSSNAEANAKLIASAPMLLEALQKVKSELMYENLINKEKSSGRNWQVELDIINQVIKKATE